VKLPRAATAVLTSPNFMLSCAQHDDSSESSGSKDCTSMLHCCMHLYISPAQHRSSWHAPSPQQQPRTFTTSSHSPQSSGIQIYLNLSSIRLHIIRLDCLRCPTFPLPAEASLIPQPAPTELQEDHTHDIHTTYAGAHVLFAYDSTRALLNVPPVSPLPEADEPKAVTIDQGTESKQNDQ
jgi:hypothetical protein